MSKLTVRTRTGYFPVVPKQKQAGDVTRQANP
jgi:hypothetical protein